MFPQLLINQKIEKFHGSILLYRGPRAENFSADHYSMNNSLMSEGSLIGSIKWFLMNRSTYLLLKILTLFKRDKIPSKA